MNRTVRLASLGALAGLLTWLLSEPFARTAANHGVEAGNAIFSIGSFYGWFAHLTLGATIVGLLSFFVSLERTRPAKAILWGLAGLVLGGFLGWFADSRSDLISIRLLRAGTIPMLGATLIWHFAVSMGLALGLALCTQPTPARVARILAGGGVAGLGSFLVRQILAPITIAFALLHGGRGGWQPFDPDRLFDHMVIGLILGLCVGLGETMLTSARIRLVLGRNEGREFALGGGLNRIGSTEGIEVPLFGATGIGPVHAQVWRQGGRWHLADASGGLSGGTRVNGQPIAGCLLHGGETIEIGPFRLRFLLRHGGEISAQVPVLPQAPAPIPVPVPVPSVTVAHRLVDPFGAVIDLADGPTLLGRDPSSKIRLTHDGLVSRLHARVVVSGSAATVEDLGSRNGTEVNGVRIAGPTPLDNGDTVRVGATTIAYRR